MFFFRILNNSFFLSFYNLRRKTQNMKEAMRGVGKWFYILIQNLDTANQ